MFKYQTILSPLDQFEIRNLFSIGTPLLANMNLSITNIGLEPGPISVVPPLGIDIDTGVVVIKVLAASIYMLYILSLYKTQNKNRSTNIMKLTLVLVWDQDSDCH
jgi:hypothetical protein